MDESLKNREKEIFDEIKRLENESRYAALINATDIYTKMSALRIELLYISSIKNEESSKRFANWSLALSVTAIAVTIIFSGVQIYLSKIQVQPILNDSARADARWRSICETSPSTDVTLANGKTTPCKEYFPDLKSK